MTKLFFKIFFLISFSLPAMAMDECYGKDENGEDLWVMGSRVGFGPGDDNLVRLNNGELVVPCGLRSENSQNLDPKWQKTYLSRFDSEFVSLVDQKIKVESASENIYQCLQGENTRFSFGQRREQHSDQIQQKCARRSLQKLLQIVLQVSYDVYGVEIKNMVIGETQYENLNSQNLPGALVNDLEEEDKRLAFFSTLRVSFEKVVDFVNYEGNVHIGSRNYKVRVSPFIEAPQVEADIWSLDLKDASVEFGLVSEVLSKSGQKEMEMVLKVQPHLNGDYSMGLAATKICRVFDAVSFRCQLDLDFEQVDGDYGFAVFFRGYLPF